MPAPRVRWLYTACCATLLAACGAGCSNKPLSRESEPAVAPNAPRWQRATVSMIFQQRGSNYPERISYWLQLAGTGGEQKSTIEQVFPATGVPSPSEVPIAEYALLKKKAPRVQLAPDGHALVFSRDGGPHYRYVALDSGDTPVYCAHLVFAPDPSGNPWPAAPTSRDLALAVLRTRGNQGDVHFPSPDGAWSGAFEQEALGAIFYACAHREDPELRTEILSAAKRFPSFATSVVMRTLTTCAASWPGAR